MNPTLKLGPDPGSLAAIFARSRRPPMQVAGFGFALALPAQVDPPSAGGALDQPAALMDLWDAMASAHAEYEATTRGK